MPASRRCISVLTGPFEAPAAQQQAIACCLARRGCIGESGIGVRVGVCSARGGNVDAVSKRSAEDVCVA
jgi:hypothetical protein